MGAPRTSDKVLKYFHDNKDVQVNINEMVATLGLEKSQIQNAVNNLKSRYRTNIDTVLTGNIWVFRSGVPEIKPGSIVYEQIGVSSNGVIVIQDENGKMFKAVEIV